MASPRFAFALDTGAFEIPIGSRVALLEPKADADVSLFDGSSVSIQQTFKPDYDALSDRGLNVSDEIAEPADIVHVTLPRSRELSRGLIAQAEVLANGGTVFVDGSKTDGIDAFLKAIKTNVPIGGQLSKAHGKLIWFAGADHFRDWILPEPAKVSGEWFTQPGVFSADGPDAGSVALVRSLPKALKGEGADLGGGWGFLTKHLLEHEGVKHIDLVEADKRALDCAKLNASDPRVSFHWADARRWGKKGSLDWVVMNPPFHTGRTPDTSLGQAFISSAARLLRPKGQLILVANRHLPYETTLAAHFQLVQELDGDSRFKVLQADQPKTPERAVTRRRR